MTPPLDLPIWIPEQALIHIGTLDPSDKGCRGDSLEGHGLSVSDCPEAWLCIAKLGGMPWWQAEADGDQPPQFLDLHRTSDEQNAAIMDWAVSSGHATPATGYKFSWYDSEIDGYVSSVLGSSAQAHAEFDFYEAEYRADPDHARAPSLTEFSGWALTPQAAQRLRLRRTSLTQTQEMCALLYVEDTTQLDGVFWDDEYDPAGLSAPRAVILPQRLLRFHFSPIETPRLRDAQAFRSLHHPT